MAADLVAGIAELVPDVVAEVRDLVGRALLAVGLAPGLLGLLVGLAHRLLDVGLGVFVTHSQDLLAAGDVPVGRTYGRGGPFGLAMKLERVSARLHAGGGPC